MKSIRRLVENKMKKKKTKKRIKRTKKAGKARKIKRTKAKHKKRFDPEVLKEVKARREAGKRYIHELRKQQKEDLVRENEELEFMIKSIEINNPGIDPRILDAFRIIDRKIFVSNDAYMDAPVHIKHGQTISQPTTIARMLQALKLRPGMNVLEIGANTGYHAALVAWLVSPGHVTTIEIFRDLALAAVENVKKMIKKLEEGKQKKKLNVDIFRGDALHERSQIWEREYDIVYYTAGVEPQQLGLVKKLALRVLNENGMLLFPTRESFDYGGMELWQKKYGRLFFLRRDDGYAFVPVIRQKDLEDLYQKERVKT